MTTKAGARVRKSKIRRRAKAVLPKTLLDRAASDAIELPRHLRQNSPWTRMWLERQALLASDKGGLSRCSESQRMIIKHVSTLDVELTLQTQRLEQAENGGTHQDLNHFQRCFNALRRGLETLGLDRSAVPINGDAKTIEAEPADETNRLRLEMERRAFQGSDALLGQLWRAENEKQREDDEDPPMRVFEISK